MTYDPNETVGPMVISICIAFGVLTVIVISGRIFARFFVARVAGPDDYLMILASIFSWAFIVITIMAVQHGLGSHIEVVLQRGQQNLVEYAQIVWISSIFYNACLGFIKTSVLALYARLGDPGLRRLALIMIAVVGCQASANVLTCIFQCNPIAAAWDLSITKKTCVNINAFYLANAALNIVTDLLAYALPIRLVMKLQMPFRQKVVLCVMMFLGLFACISSIVRITFIPEMLVNPDATWAISAAMYWSVIETNIGILAASIPTFKAIAKRYAPHLVGEYSSGSNSRRFQDSRRSRTMGSFNKLDPHGPVALRSMNRGPDGVPTQTHTSMNTDALSHGKRSVKTVIEHKMSENSSEERIVMPEGQIMAQTEITRHTEDSSDKASSC